MFRVRTSGLVGFLGIALLAAGCSVTTTANVLHKPEAKVTPQEQVALYFAAQALADQARHAPSPGPSGCDYEGLIRSTFVEDPDWAVAIAWRESRCQPDAANPSGSMGLFQMLLPLHDDLFYAVGCTPDQWSDPVCNVNAAHLLYRGAGRQPWNL